MHRTRPLHRPRTSLAGSRALPLLCLGSLLLATPVTSPSPAVAAAEAEVRSADDLLIVDCLLPHKVRRLGRNNTFLAPRQPIRTTAADCRIRGGEYTEPDQASYATALEVWLPQAKAGDAEAQFYVGQIFERGLGTAADYESAGVWYRRAAEQDYTPAQVSLGYLYEEGLGVEADDEEALRWYRRAAGLDDDLVVMEASQLESIRADLAAREGQIRTLEAQVEELTRQLDAMEEKSDADAARVDTLQSLIDRLRTDLSQTRTAAAEARQQLASARQLRGRHDSADAPAAAVGASAASAGDLLSNLSELMEGEYHALIIGNSRYQKLPELAGADDDARRVAEVLEERYGFRVQLLLDADRYQILSALDELRKALASEDRLVVYYTGHGHRQLEGRDAWWQPVDADPENPVNWIPSALVAEHLDLMAPNHVLLLANAVFGGLRTRSSVASLPQGMTSEERLAHVRRLLERRTRLVLQASDAEGRPDHGFNAALVAALESNDGVLEASKLYEAVNERLYEQRGDASNLEFATLRWARNDLADFFFVPSSR